MFHRLFVLAALFLANVAMAAVDVNKASAADLDGLTGVGPATTQLILSERKKGEFRSWDDLMKRVKGIGAARASKLSDAGLTVGGASYKDKGRPANAPVMTPAAVVPTTGQATAEKKSAARSDEKAQSGKKAAETASSSR